MFLSQKVEFNVEKLGVNKGKFRYVHKSGGVSLKTGSVQLQNVLKTFGMSQKNGDLTKENVLDFKLQIS